MPYVQRDANGNIKGVFMERQPQEDGSELTDPKPLKDDNPEVAAYFVKINSKPPAATLDQRLAAIGLTKADIKAAML